MEKFDIFYGISTEVEAIHLQTFSGDTEDQRMFIDGQSQTDACKLKSSDVQTVYPTMKDACE